MSDHLIDVECESDADLHVETFRKSCKREPIANVTNKKLKTGQRRKKRKVQLGQYKYTTLQRRRQEQHVQKILKKDSESSSSASPQCSSHSFNINKLPDNNVKLLAANDENDPSLGQKCHQSSQTVNFENYSKGVQCDVACSSCSRFQHVNSPSEYFSNCLETLLNVTFLTTLLRKFKEVNLLQHFMAFLNSIVNGSLPASNIAVILCLERSMLQSLSSSTNMRYSPESKQFWELIYKIGGGQLIRLMSGSKHFNQLNEQKVTKNKYTPATGDYNFAVPDERILSKSICNLPREIMPGIIEECLYLINPQHEYILSVDAKKCAMGLLDYGYGDIDLWNFEDPSLLDRKAQLDSDIAFIAAMETISLHDRSYLLQQSRLLGKLINILSHRIKTVREAIVRHEKQKISMHKTMNRKNETYARYAHGFSVVEAFIARAKNNIDKLLKCNLALCHIMANLNQTQEYMPSGQCVNLLKQRNSHFLLTPAQIDNDEFLTENPQYVQQRSTLWHECRMLSRVTASTLYDAIGLRSLTQQRNHYKHYVLKQPPKPFKPHVKAAIDFGSRHEINVIATLVTLFASSYLPKCFHYYEVGSKYTDGDNIAKLMITSPDGVFKCSMKHDPEHSCKSIFKFPFQHDMTVEIKSIFSAITNKTLTPVLYAPTKFHVAQTIAQMFSWDKQGSLYATAGLESVSVCYLKHDDDLWNTMWDMVKEFYDDDNIEIPDYQSPSNGQCHTRIAEFIENNSTFLCELPLIKSLEPTDAMQMNDTGIHETMSMYKAHLGTEPEVSTRDWDSAISEWKTVLKEAKEAVQEAFQLERRKATELLMFVISNSDRISCKEYPLTIPVAYALKGRSLKQDTMRQLLDHVYQTLHANEARLLCTTMDGQWQGIVCRDRHDNPLTELQLQRDVWKKFKDMKLPEILNFIHEATMVYRSDLEKCAKFQADTVGYFQNGNIAIALDLTPDANGQLHRTLNVRCIGGTHKLPAFMAKMHLASCTIRPDLYRSQTITVDLLSILTEYAKSQGMNILSNDTCCCALDTSGMSFQKPEHILLHTNAGILILEHILVSLLALKRFAFWQSVEVTEMFHRHMHDGDSIYRCFTIPELEVTLQHLLQFHGYTEIMRDLPSKLHKVNFLARLLGKRPKYAKPQVYKQVPSLRNLAIASLKVHVPLLLMQECIARVYHEQAYDNWIASQSVPNYIELPFSPHTFDYFSFPGMDSERSTVQPSTIDPTHILTNLRLHCTTKSVFHCDPAAFLRVCDTDSTALSRAVVTELLDKQNCAIAESVFSERVEQVMIQNGDIRESNLVKHIRHWFDATNKRGISVTQRIKYLVQMDYYCRRFWSGNKYPAPGMYVCGLPYQTFEAVLQSISCRLQLYKLSLKHCYNQRSVSTLHLESIFADVSTIAKQTNGCPLACEVPKQIAKMLHINSTKHDPHKCFSVRLAKKSNYPCMIGNAKRDFLILHYENNNIFQPHDFDFPDIKNRKKKHRRTDISNVDAPERGTLPVRTHFKIDESRVNATLRL